MRRTVAFFVLALAGCGFDASGLGADGSADGTGSSGNTETAAATEPATSIAPGTESTVGASSGPSVDGDSSTTSGSGSTTASDATSTSASSSDDEGTATDGTTGEPVGLPCPNDPELAACYDFVGVGGGTLLDLSGNGNDGTVVGVGVVPGPFGEAATFDADSEIAVPDSPSLDITGSLTLEAWLVVDAVPPTGRVGVLDKNGQYSLMIYASDEYRCDISGASLYVGPVVLGEWSHVACVFDGATLRAYVNGTEVGMLAGGPLLTDDVEPMSIGDTSPDFTEPLAGAIGGMRVWSRALDSVELCAAARVPC